MLPSTPSRLIPTLARSFTAFNAANTAQLSHRLPSLLVRNFSISPSSSPTTTFHPAKLLSLKALYVARDIDIIQVYQSVVTSPDLNSLATGRGAEEGAEERTSPTHSFHGDSVIIDLPPSYGSFCGSPVDEGEMVGRKKTKKGGKKMVAELGSKSQGGRAAGEILPKGIDKSADLDVSTPTDLDASSSESPLVVPALDRPTPSPRYVIVFKYGSVVFVNVSPALQAKLLPIIKKHSTKALPTGFEHDDMYGILIDEASMGKDREANGSDALHEGCDSEIHAEYIKLSELDINHVAVISTVMGQTVALDYYSDVVDQMLDTFTRLNSTVENTGKFSSMERTDLFKVVASNNSVFIGLVARLGLLERSDTAWDHSSYGQIEENMRVEFELDDRFKNLEFKLNLIQHNTRFFIEILHNQKSNKLEWIIVFLIAFESSIMILDMSGVGGRVFGFLSDII